MKETIIYNYITTDLSNGKQYVGTHSTNNVDDGYLGSGTYLLRAIKKYSKENFNREILCVCDTSEEAFENEKKFIEQYNTLIPNGMNISPTGGVAGCGMNSAETLKKIGVSMKGKKHSEETKRKISITMLAISDDARKNRISESLKGRPVSEETRLKMSKANKGKKRSKEVRKRISESGKGRIPWNKGIPASEETKEKLSKAHIGVPLSEKHCQNISKALKGHKTSEETKQKISKANRGRKYSKEIRQKMGQTRKGKTWEEIYGIEEAKKRREVARQRKLATQ